MNLERRLQHAARELRELPIEVPTLDRPSTGHRARGPTVRTTSRARPGRLVPVLAAPLLFVAGGLFVLGAGAATGQPTHSDLDAVIRPAVGADLEPGRLSTPGADLTQPLADVELRLLEQDRVDDTPTRGPDAAPVTDPLHVIVARPM